jgi:hypothetical protein
MGGMGVGRIVEVESIAGRALLRFVTGLEEQVVGVKVDKIAGCQEAWV